MSEGDKAFLVTMFLFLGGYIAGFLNNGVYGGWVLAPAFFACVVYLVRIVFRKSR